MCVCVCVCVLLLLLLPLCVVTFLFGRLLSRCLLLHLLLCLQIQTTKQRLREAISSQEEERRERRRKAAFPAWRTTQRRLGHTRSLSLARVASVSPLKAQLFFFDSFLLCCAERERERERERGRRGRGREGRKEGRKQDREAAQHKHTLDPFVCQFKVKHQSSAATPWARSQKTTRRRLEVCAWHCAAQ